MATTVNPQLTRGARRLYVGNLPSVGFDEAALKEIFRTTIVALGIATPQPIQAVWLSKEHTYGFVEFRSVQDAALALMLLQGMQLAGHTLKISRAADYTPAPPHLATHVVGFPQGQGAPLPLFANNVPFMTLLAQGQSPFTNPLMMQLLTNPPPAAPEAAAGAPAGAPESGALAAPAVAAAPPAAFAGYAPPVGAAAAAPVAAAAVAPAAAPVAAAPVLSSPAVPTIPPTRVLLLQNMVTLTDLTDEDSFLDRCDDIEEESEKCGVVRSLAIPRPLAPLGAPPAPASSRGPRVPLGQGTGRIFVEFESVDAAQAAQTKMNGRVFNGNKVVAAFYPEAAYTAKKWV